MKKRLLITSIVMMLVVAVALSTATYAWFTSNETVTASTITLTASNSEGAAIGIAWGDAGASSSIEAKAATGTMSPMVPASLVTQAAVYASEEDDITEATTSAVTFSGATVRNEGGTPKFNTASTNLNPFKYTSTDQTPVEYFRVTNLSTANDVTVTLTLKDLTGQEPAAITDENSLLRVGVFTSDSASGTYNLVAVMGVSENLPTEWGNVTTDGVVANLTAANAEIPTVTSYEFDLDAEDTLYFRVIAWLDGVALNDNTAGSTANFGLHFSAAQAE